LIDRERLEEYLGDEYIDGGGGGGIEVQRLWAILWKIRIVINYL